MLIKSKFLKIFKQIKYFKSKNTSDDSIVNSGWRSSKLIQMKISTSKLQQELKSKIEELKLNLGSSVHLSLTDAIEFKFVNSFAMLIKY